MVPMPSVVRRSLHRPAGRLQKLFPGRASEERLTSQAPPPVPEVIVKDLATQRQEWFTETYRLIKGFKPGEYDIFLNEMLKKMDGYSAGSRQNENWTLDSYNYLAAEFNKSDSLLRKIKKASFFCKESLHDKLAQLLLEFVDLNKDKGCLIEYDM
jgi:hypothetical protein